MHPSRPPLPPINFAALADALLARADALLAAWLPGGRRAGHEYQCGSLSGGAGTSCSVNVNTGAWADFATDERGGDLVSLYAAMHGLDMGKAAVQVARDEGLEDVAGVQRSAQHQRAERPPPPPAAPTKPAAPREAWRTLLPVPDFAPPPTFVHYHRAAETIDRKAEYRVGGQLLGYVVRFRTSAADKEDIPYTFCQSDGKGGCAWRWRQFDEPRPLFLPGGALPARADGTRRTVVLVEGERKAELLQALLDAGAPDVYVVASWPGGCKAWDKALWDWLAGCTVICWPDCDSQRVKLSAAERKACGDDLVALEVAKAAKPYLPADKQPGLQARPRSGGRLQRAHGSAEQVLPVAAPGVKPSGWDAADAIAEGWDFERVMAYFGQAQALPPDPDDAPAAGGAGGGAGGGGPPKNEGPVGTGGEDPAPDDDDNDDARPVWLQPYWDGLKRRWLVSRKLVIAALTQDPALSGVLGRNDLSNTIEARRDWPWAHGVAGPLTGSTDLALGQYLTERYGLPSISRQALAEAIETVGVQCRFHPVRDYLRSRAWDGTPRVDKWLIHVLGLTPAQLQPTMREYLALVGRFWLLAMVYRVFEPGCKFDYCPVLEGPGGFRKSTLVEVLASPAFFSDTHFDVGKGKEGQEQVQGLWLYEIAELANFGKTDIALIKAFISAKVDRYRPAYGRVMESYARQCVMVGTTNEQKYLRDRTGNRRFWPIPVRQRINTEWLQRWRDQLFAEAYQLYLEGAPYTPAPQDEARLFAPMQDSRLVDTAVQGELLRLLTRDPSASELGALVNNLTDFVTMPDLVRVLGTDVGKSSAGLEAQIRSWMEHEGWTYTRRRVEGARAMGYLRPPGWPPEDDGGDGPLMDELVPAPAPDSPTPEAPDGGAAGTSSNVHGAADDTPF